MELYRIIQLGCFRTLRFMCLFGFGMQNLKQKNNVDFYHSANNLCSNNRWFIHRQSLSCSKIVFHQNHHRHQRHCHSLHLYCQYYSLLFRLILKLLLLLHSLLILSFHLILRCQPHCFPLEQTCLFVESFLILMEQNHLRIQHA